MLFKTVRVFIVLVLISSAGCIPKVRHVKAGERIPPGKMIITGSITITPEPKQELHTKGLVENFKKASFLMFDSNPDKEIDTEIMNVEGGAEMRGFESILRANWGETFFCEMPRKNSYLKGMHVASSTREEGLNTLIVMLNYSLQINSADEFVYIGDLHFFMNKKGKFYLKIADNFEEYRKKYSGVFAGENSKPLMLTKRILVDKDDQGKYKSDVVVDPQRFMDLIFASATESRVRPVMQ